MTTEDSTTRVVADSGADVGPGERLREARQAAHLTVGEVASRLRLEPRVIERLESDDYEQLHGPTFVRGYLSGFSIFRKARYWKRTSATESGRRHWSRSSDASPRCMSAIFRCAW